MSDFFKGIEPVPFKGPDSDDPLAFRFYEKDRLVLGKPMRDQLRMAVAYWHSFAWPGGDPFGGQTFERPWFGDGMAAAELKAEVAFEMFQHPRGRLLHLPRPRRRARGQEPRRERPQRARRSPTSSRAKMEETGVELLWGTANLFSNRRYMAGAATNPDPDVFAYAAAQVKSCIDVTHDLKGANYVLWGGREGYETLLNTDMKQELDHAGRFLSMVVDYKHKIGFQGTILIEPKPQEPTKHQYDYDVATVFGFLQRFGLEKEVKVNIETGPRGARRAFLRARDRHRDRARDLRLGRRQPQRLPVGLGHRPVPEQRARDRAGALLHPAGRRPDHRRASTSTPSSAGSRSTRWI